MKSLSIKSDNCLLNKNNYNVSLNDSHIDDLIRDNLPAGLEDYRDYAVKVSIQIEFLGEEGLKVDTEGYEPKKENSEEENTVE